MEGSMEPEQPQPQDQGEHYDQEHQYDQGEHQEGYYDNPHDDMHGENQDQGYPHTSSESYQPQESLHDQSATSDSKQQEMNAEDQQQQHEGEEPVVLQTDESGAPTSSGPYIPTYNVFIARIPFDATDDELMRVFTPVGRVRNGFIVRDKATSRSLGFGFIHFEEEEAQRKCLNELRNSFRLKGMLLEIKPAECKKTLFLGGLPFTLQDDELRKIVEEKVQGLISCEIKRGPPPESKSKGFAFLDFETPHDAEQAKRILSRLAIQNMACTVAWAQPRPQLTEDEIKNVLGIYVTGVPASTDDSDFSKMFEEIGDFDYCRIPRHQETGNARGYAFVYYKNHESATRAYELLKDREYQGQKLGIEYLIPQGIQKKGPTSRGRGGPMGMTRGGGGGARGGYYENTGPRPYGRGGYSEAGPGPYRGGGRGGSRGGGGYGAERHAPYGYPREDSYSGAPAPRGGFRGGYNSQPYQGGYYDEGGDSSYQAFPPSRGGARGGRGMGMSRGGGRGGYRGGYSGGQQRGYDQPSYYEDGGYGGYQDQSGGYGQGSYEDYSAPASSAADFPPPRRPQRPPVARSVPPPTSSYYEQDYPPQQSSYGGGQTRHPYSSAPSYSQPTSTAGSGAVESSGYYDQPQQGYGASRYSQQTAAAPAPPRAATAASYGAQQSSSYSTYRQSAGSSGGGGSDWVQVMDASTGQWRSAAPTSQAAPPRSTSGYGQSQYPRGGAGGAFASSSPTAPRGGAPSQRGGYGQPQQRYAPY